MCPPELARLLNPFSGMWGGVAIEQIILWLGSYVYFAYTLSVIASKMDVEQAWMAWIPIANFYLMCRMADRSVWLLVLLMVPLANVVVLAVLWIDITNERLGFGWPGILAVIPVVNIAFSGYLAFSE